MTRERGNGSGGGAPRAEARAALLSALRSYRDENGDAASVDCLLRAATEPGLGARGRRREELLERMTRHGIPVDLAADAYDLALEEGVDPAFALELVRCGVGVVELPGEGAEDAPASEAWPEEWLGVAPPPREARRERRLRATFRRLRRLLAEHGTPEAALTAFAEEPDVGACEF